MKKSILIVNFGSPPNPGIGGRRWAMFSHFLADEGYEIQVLCKANKTSNGSLYDDYVLNNTKVKMNYFKSFFPTILDQIPVTLFEKIRYKIWLKICLIVSKGTPYDRSIFSKKKLKKNASNLIKKHNIKQVIVTGAPFRVTYVLAELKSEMGFNLLVDFRDPWTWGKGYGYANLSSKRMTFEKSMESFVVKTANTVYTPVEIMHQSLIELYAEFKSKIKLLPHGFDSINIVQHDGDRFKSKKDLKLVFIGSLYANIGHYFEAIAKAISDSNITINLDIYSDSERYTELMDQYNLIGVKVNYFKPVLPKILYKALGNYDFCLILYPDYAIDYISTKFYELVYSNTPILYIGKPGLTSQFVSEKRVGLYIEENNIYEAILNGEFTKGYEHKPSIDINKFAYNTLTKRVIDDFN